MLLIYLFICIHILTFLFFSFLRACCPDAGPLTQSGTTALLYVCVVGLVGLVGLFSAGPYVELCS